MLPMSPQPVSLTSPRSVSLTSPRSASLTSPWSASLTSPQSVLLISPRLHRLRCPSLHHASPTLPQPVSLMSPRPALPRPTSPASPPACIAPQLLHHPGLRCALPLSLHLTPCIAPHPLHCALPPALRLTSCIAPCLPLRSSQLTSLCCHSPIIAFQLLHLGRPAIAGPFECRS